MQKKPFNRDWCTAVAKAQLDSIQQSFRTLRFCMEKDPEAVREVIESLGTEHPLLEVLRKAV